jgi:hypothetical protein
MGWGKIRSSFPALPCYDGAVTHITPATTDKAGMILPHVFPLLGLIIATHLTAHDCIFDSNLQEYSPKIKLSGAKKSEAKHRGFPLHSCCS